MANSDTLENDPENREKNSKEFGLNYRSAFMQLNHFDICGGVFVPDIMHDLLEGTLQYEAKLIISHAINQKYLTYKRFTDIVGNCELGYMEQDNRPSAIPPDTLSSNGRTLGQKGKYKY